MFGGFQLGRSTPAGGARSVEKNMIGERPNRLLVVQTGESVNRGKPLRATCRDTHLHFFVGHFDDFTLHR